MFSRSFSPSATARVWKRPLLVLLALPVIGLGAAISIGSQSTTGLVPFIISLLLGLGIVVYGLLAIGVSIFGCGACVAKILGRWAF